MKEQISNVIDFLKGTDVAGCITGSCLLGYFEGQDVDVFLYNFFVIIIKVKKEKNETF